MPSKARLQVVIVSYNVKHYAAQTIRSVLRAASHLPLEVWVVDNASQDGSVEHLRSRFPDIHIIANNNNVGFSRANNVAIQQSDTDYVLLLNPDTIVAEKTLCACVEYMDAHPDIGAAGCRMQNSNGTFARESRRALPTPWISMLKMMGRAGHYYMSMLPLDEPAEIEIMSGAFMMLRRSALEKVGLLDERFFMYGEDIDLSYRMTLRGYKNYYLPYPILHYKGESTQKSSFRYIHVFYDAMLIFYNKHFARRYRLLTMLIRLAVVARAAMDYVNQKRHSLQSHVAIKDPTERYLVQATPEHLPAIEAILKANNLPYDIMPNPSDSAANPAQALLSAACPAQTSSAASPAQAPSSAAYTFLLIDDAHPYSHILAESRHHEGLQLAIYQSDEHQIITSDDIIK